MIKSSSTVVGLGQIEGLMRKVNEGEGVHVFVDLERVDEIDRQTISSLAVLKNMLARRGFRLVICGANSIIEVVLKLHCPGLEFYALRRHHHYH